MLPILFAISFAASVVANPIPEPHERFDLMKRVCASQAAGAGPTPDPDTAAAFLEFSEFTTSAKNAETPAGYIKTYTDLHASSNAHGYLGYTLLGSYDASACASQCNERDGCESFNIFFERAPLQNPDDASCSNPPSTTNIKCVFWGGPVVEDNASNTGATFNQFQAVIAGSNGYMNSSIFPSAGYNMPNYLEKASIQAPNNCHNANTYMGFQIFQGAFDASKCAAACTAQTEWNIAHPPTDGSPAMTCQFFNTFQSLKNGVSEGQWCVLYNETWSDGYATNTGYQSGSDVYTIAHSYTYANVFYPVETCSSN